MIGDQPVDLLGHGPIEAPETGFDVGNADVEFCRRECGGQRRVYVADYQHQIWSTR